jgi:hypothetical protein
MEGEKMYRICLVALVVGALSTGCGEKKEEPAPSAPEPIAEPAPEPAPEPEPKPAPEPIPEPKPQPAAAPTGETGGVADVMKLVPEGGKKEPVPFPHKLHADAANPGTEGKCAICHHKPTVDSEYPKCKTAGCHDGRTAGNPLPKDAFHERCRDTCHKQTLAEQPDNEKLKAVKKCKGCHAG